MHSPIAENMVVVLRENGVCKQLDMMANYILYSPGAERVNPKNTEYNFYTEEKFPPLMSKKGKKANIDAIVNKINNQIKIAMR